MSIDIYEGYNVGEIIRKLRERGRSRNGHSLSQLELSLQIGWENPSTLSRIESGKVVPSRDTLIKICKSLNLSSIETFTLLNKLSYSAYRPKVDDKYIRKMINMYKEEVDSYPFPAMLEYSRKFIYMNKFTHKFFLDSNPELKKATKEKTYLEIVFFPEYGLKDKLVNWEEFSRYVAVNTKLLLPSTIANDTNMESVLKKLRENRLFQKMFKLGEKVVNKRGFKLHNIPFTYNHPHTGVLCFLVSQFPLHIDERFYIMHFRPSTERDIKNFARYTKK